MRTTQVGARDALVALSVAGRPQAEVAQAAGISIRTLRRRLQEPGVVEAIAAGIKQRESEALGRLSDLRSRVFDVLDDHLVADDPVVQLRAARLVLEQGLAHRVAHRADRLALLELSLARLEERDSVNGGQ